MLTEASALLRVSPGVWGGGGATGLPPAAPAKGLGVGTAAPVGVAAAGGAEEPGAAPPLDEPRKLDIGGRLVLIRLEESCCCWLGDMVP